MATLRELKGRIGSVSSSEKITGAMKMISSAKMHKAEMTLNRLVPYKNQIQLIFNHLLSADADYSSPLIEEREVKKISLIVFGSDDGLCGAYNIQVFKALLQRLNTITSEFGTDIKIEIIPVGKKITHAAKKLKSSQIEVNLNAEINTRSNLDAIKQFTNNVKDEFIEHRTDKVEVIYTHFKSASRQVVLNENIFPISYASLIENTEKKELNRPYIFEPDANTIFETILPLYILSQMQEIASENIASEQASRIMAMQSANDNAKNLLEDLQLDYNKLRQQSITTELLDILGGQARD